MISYFNFTQCYSNIVNKKRLSYKFYTQKNRKKTIKKNKLRKFAEKVIIIFKKL